MNATLKEIDESCFVDHLNDTFGYIDICGRDYLASDALWDVDPARYRKMYSDFLGEQDDIWICDECGQEYDDEDDATICCDDSAYMEREKERSDDARFQELRGD